VTEKYTAMITAILQTIDLVIFRHIICCTCRRFILSGALV